MIIDCGSCLMREIACSDCVVKSFFEIPPLPQIPQAPQTSQIPQIPQIPQEVQRVTELPDETVEAIELLASRGLIAPMRFRSVVQG